MKVVHPFFEPPRIPIDEDLFDRWQSTKITTSLTDDAFVTDSRHSDPFEPPVEPVRDPR